MFPIVYRDEELRSIVRNILKILPTLEENFSILMDCCGWRVFSVMLFKLRDHTVGIARDMSIYFLRACSNEEHFLFEYSGTVCYIA